MGWLLRSNRLLGPDLDLRQQSAFASAAADVGGDTWVSPSRLSRWETGVHSVPYAVARRYETLLGLTESSLVSTIDLLHRYFATDLHQPLALDRKFGRLDPDRHRSLAEIVERVHTGAPVSGQQWDDFTAFVCSVRNVILPRPSTAAEMIGRLLSEMIVADGQEWTQRYESLGRMMAHPLFEVEGVDAVASLGRDRTNQVFIETLCALDCTDHPDAAAQVLAQLTNPTNDRAFEGALLACVRKSTLGHFSTDEVARLGPILGALITDPGVGDPTRRLARRILAHLRSHPHTRSALPELSLPRERGVGMLPPDVLERGNALVAEMQREIQDSDLVQQSHFIDQTMPALVKATVLDPVPDQRLYLAMLLRVSPYRQVIANAASRRISSPGHPELRPALLNLTRVLGDDEQAPQVEAAVLDPRRTCDERSSAARAVGHVRSGTSSPFWDQVVAQQLAAASEGRQAESAQILSGVVYSLGVGGHFDQMTELDRERLPQGARDAVGWWLNLPEPVRLSVQSPAADLDD